MTKEEKDIERTKLISLFQENVAKSSLLVQKKKYKHDLKVYENGDIGNPETDRVYPGSVIHLEAKGTTACAYDKTQILSENEKVGVLCFASASNPGGGVQKGRYAQEESLCMETSLYHSITTMDAYGKFYYPNRSDMHAKMKFYPFKEMGSGRNRAKDITGVVYSRRLLYVPNVFLTKILDRSEHEHHISIPDPPLVDVICMAMPRFLSKIPKNSFNDEIYQVYKSRIEDVLKAFYKNGCTHIVLGAWGCGAFRNSPEMVAKAFKEVLDGGWIKSFKDVTFAIPVGKDSNYRIFKEILLPK